MPKKTLSFSLSVEPGAPYPPPPPPYDKIPGSAQDTTVKLTVLDAQAHLCLLASNALHVVKKKSEFPVRFFGFVTVYRGLLCTHWKFKKGVLAVARHLIKLWGIDSLNL